MSSEEKLGALHRYDFQDRYLERSGVKLSVEDPKCNWVRNHCENASRWPGKSPLATPGPWWHGIETVRNGGEIEVTGPEKKMTASTLTASS